MRKNRASARTSLSLVVLYASAIFAALSIAGCSKPPYATSHSLAVNAEELDDLYLSSKQTGFDGPNTAQLLRAHYWLRTAWTAKHYTTSCSGRFGMDCTTDAKEVYEESIRHAVRKLGPLLVHGDRDAIHYVALQLPLESRLCAVVPKELPGNPQGKLLEAVALTLGCGRKRDWAEAMKLSEEAVAAGFWESWGLIRELSHLTNNLPRALHAAAVCGELDGESDSDLSVSRLHHRRCYSIESDRKGTQLRVEAWPTYVPTDPSQLLSGLREHLKCLRALGPRNRTSPFTKVEAQAICEYLDDLTEDQIACAIRETKDIAGSQRAAVCLKPQTTHSQVQKGS